MSVEFTKNVTLTGVCAFNYGGVAVSSASWGVWNDTSNTKLGYAGVRANANIRYAFVYAFSTPSWDGDITKITLAIKLQEELGNSRTIRWSLTTTDPTQSTSWYTGQDLPTDSGRVDDGTISVDASTEKWYTVEIDLAALSKNATYYLVLSPYTTASGTSNYATVNMQSSWADVFAGYITYEAEASDVSAPDGYIGSEMTIQMTNDGLSKTLTYEFGSATGTIISGTTAASATWTPPTSLMNQIQSAESGTCTITCTSAAGETTCTCILSVPDSIKPAITAKAIALVNSNATVNTWNVCLQNFSQIRTTFTAAASYSRLVSYSISGGAFTAEGEISNTLTFSGNVTSAILTAAGNYTVTLTVTDQRGRSTTVTVGTYTVTAYTAPTATGVTIYRSDSSGVEDSDGTYISARATRSYTQVGSNTCSMYLEYKEKSAASYTQVAMTDNTLLTTGGGNVDVLKTYIARIYVVDSLAGNYIYVSIGTQNVAFNLYPSVDSGAAFGGYATEEKILELLNDWALRLPSTEHLIMYASDGITEQTLQDLLDAISGGGTLDYTALSNKPSLNSHTLNGAVTLANIGLVTSLSSASTDAQFPSAKCVYDLIGDVETFLAAL